MKYAMLFGTILALASPMAIAGAKCDCTKKCKTECQTGKSKNCKCKHCDCAKGGKCDAGCGGEANADPVTPATK